MKLGSVLEFKNLVGVSDISSAFRWLPAICVAYIYYNYFFFPVELYPWTITFVFGRRYGHHFFIYPPSEKSNGSGYVSATVHFDYPYVWLFAQSCGQQHKCDYHFSDLVHLRNWTFDLVSFFF